ncbi:MAG TPA: helix-turn-helix transcriptional regulator [Nostocaceae cyanobacterium]|nr:helix-turn-helix transcriptional regulator [Nostocaceae cyanobacterium]
MKLVLCEETMNSEYKKRLAKVVKELRGDESYREFGKKFPIVYSAVSAWEKGESIPSTKNLEKLAAMRGESLNEFLDYLNGKRDSENESPTTKVIQQIQLLPRKDLHLILRVVADRMNEIR